MRTIDLKVDIDDSGQARSATAAARIDRPLSRVWQVIAEVERYPERLPMIHRVRLEGTRAHVELKFKVSLFSVGFHFVVDVLEESEKWLELRYVSGEPRGIRLRFELEPLDDGKACLLRGSGEFDVNSLGWLTKYFLKHHPEIQFGVLPGVALGLLESMRAAAAGP
jgi:ribosome-associated toxin RatA of RatAB toxin-antitoxin module